MTVDLSSLTVKELETLPVEIMTIKGTQKGLVQRQMHEMALSISPSKSLYMFMI